MLLAFSQSALPLLAADVAPAANHAGQRTNAATTGNSWGPARRLPDSTGSLRWTKPKQARMAEIHRDQPGYLQQAPSVPIALPSDAAATGDIRPASHLVVTAGVEPNGDEVFAEPELAAEPPLRLTPPRQAMPLRASGDRDSSTAQRGVRLVAAGDDGSDADAVFDDVLDEILPGNEPAARPTAPPAEAPAADLPGFDDEPLPDNLMEDPAPPRANSTTPRSGSAAQPANPAEASEIDSIFGDEALPDSLADEPTAEDAGDLPADAAHESDPAFPEPESDAAADELPSMPAEDEPALPSPSDQQPPAPRTNRPVPPSAEDLPPRRPAPSRTEAAPDAPFGTAEMYNGRDCLDETNSLQAAWDELRRTPIRNITLDISPSIKPNEGAAEREKSRQENLSRAPSRVWRGRDGQVLAEGKMRDFRKGKVIVDDVSGQERKLSWYELSNEELCFVTAWWELPSEFFPETEPYEVRNWTMTTFTWKASGLCHKPLYFEEVALERYGHSAEPVTQTVLSGAHFFGNIFFLPYQMGLHPPNECQYALGYYRPGSCAPWLLPAVPLDARAARMQVGAIAGGLIFWP